MPALSLGRIIALCVGIVALVLILLSLVAVVAVPGWVVFALIGALAVAVLVG